MIELTLPNGEPVSILPTGVFHFYASTSGTTIISTQGALLSVKESYAEVATRFRVWAKG